MDRIGWRMALVMSLLLSASGAAQGEIREEQRKMVGRVWQRLLAAADPLPVLKTKATRIKYETPAYQIEDRDEVNAYATVQTKGRGEGAKNHPQVVVFRGLLTQVAGDNEDFLAYVLGHELAHVIKGHLIPPPDGMTEIIERAFDREQELEADLEGMRLALRAGYSFKKARAGIERLEKLNRFTSFEALGMDHPSWKDRLEKLDPKQASLWRAMSAFDDGSYFLLLEQYLAAERCFAAVVDSFPDCYEGWANLGYARLMRYCDQLEAKDIKNFDVGHLLVGGFYRRPESLEIQVLKLDPSLWQDAVKALLTALEKKSGLPLAHASLGVAYLVKWDGRDVPNARKYLERAVMEAARDGSLDARARAALLVNAGVASLASGSQKGSTAKFDEAETVVTELRRKASGHPTLRALDSALLYNRALVALAGGKRREALNQFQAYLQTASPASSWYDLAYEHYAALGRSLGEPTKEKAGLAKRASLRPVTVIRVENRGEDVTIVLGQPPEKLPGAVREALKTVPAARFLKRLRYPEHDLDLLASEKAVLAIRLYGLRAPEVELRATGLSGEKAGVRVGMKEKDFDAILRDEGYYYRAFDTPDHGQPYRFFRDVGLAVRLEGGEVKELLILARQER